MPPKTRAASSKAAAAAEKKAATAEEKRASHSRAAQAAALVKDTVAPSGAPTIPSVSTRQTTAGKRIFFLSLFLFFLLRIPRNSFFNFNFQYY
jgi:hypothetical protein